MIIVGGFQQRFRTRRSGSFERRDFAPSIVDLESNSRTVDSFASPSDSSTVKSVCLHIPPASVKHSVVYEGVG